MILPTFCTSLIGGELHIHINHLHIATWNRTWLHHTLAQLQRTVYPYHFILAPGKENFIVNNLYQLDQLYEFILSKGEQIFILHVSVSKRMDYADDLLIVECFIHCPPVPVIVTVLWLTKNEYRQTKWKKQYFT